MLACLTDSFAAAYKRDPCEASEVPHPLLRPHSSASPRLFLPAFTSSLQWILSSPPSSPTLPSSLSLSALLPSNPTAGIPAVLTASSPKPHTQPATHPYTIIQFDNPIT
ncbi:hypothetical protein EW146_g4377 [Bondarzewia mesenterica]|uniref:Uncharacterized protein n=1 Tax=Bondarzewia mesenterica TaxID=1095465 RepID=A0A4S4LWL7_9AGAM|nr:hypothetical protein EW146_g4377 [Bondarzewia mesenterica]